MAANKAERVSIFRAKKNQIIISDKMKSLCGWFTNSQMYGTVTKAKPAEKFAIPMARVRNVGGYWNVVNVGIIAFATPVALLTAGKKKKKKRSRIEKCRSILWRKREQLN